MSIIDFSAQEMELDLMETVFDHLYKNVVHDPPARSNGDCPTPCEVHPTAKMLNWFDAHVQI
jgi:hypothetical protein